MPHIDIVEISEALDKLIPDVEKLQEDVATLGNRYLLLQEAFDQHLRDHSMMLAQPSDAERDLAARVSQIEQLLGRNGARKAA